MQDVFTVDEIKKKGVDGKFRTVCASGNVFEVRYFAMYGGVFFSDVPYYEEVIGLTAYEN